MIITEGNSLLKTCIKCGLQKHHSEFYKRPNRKSNATMSYCIKCANKMSSEWYVRQKTENLEAYRIRANQHSRNHTYRKLNITQEQVDEFGKNQEWKCSICGIDILNKYHLDHNHKNNEVRGLLCQRCNMGLGLFEDSFIRLLNAILYLLKYDERKSSQKFLFLIHRLKLIIKHFEVID